ncbi:hypothetical protein BDV98DRAFT_564257 [Pterulicium gracile]|uniref:CsbD-like domain-containing protein n=1 Tax=Pterulicium gracile TaxID=1884261 RepID=A0A5C3QPG8_9AGAR|nr:hypothetical protein BDV98DRAFT_564257 [Pterula gracilis]
MSNPISSNSNPNANTLGADSIPDTSRHHFHPDDEPLPTHAERQTDYSTEAIERGLPGATATDSHTSTQHRSGGLSSTTGPTTGLDSTHRDHHDSTTRDHSSLNPTTDSHHSSTGIPSVGKHEHRDSSTAHLTGTSAGIPGAGAGTKTSDSHHSANSTGKVGFGDKLIGKAQEVAGKMAKNPTMQEKGEVRRTEGKAAVAHLDHHEA